jgi:tripartite-type tricarboxylate transporter receptor subunit TctC
MAPRGLGIAFLSALCLCVGTLARAQEGAADFYRGKTISIVVGYAPGGGYDHSARFLARYFGKHIPGNPNVVVQNMPGAATLTAANHVNNNAPRDGTVLGMYADVMPLAPLLKVPGVRFDARRFGWVGSMASRGTSIVFVRSDAPAKTFQETLEKEVLIGAAGPDSTSTYALLLNELLGAKFRIVYGYKGGGAEINLALQRGEVHGRVSWDWQGLKHEKPEWISEKFVRVLLQLALKPDPELPGVPMAIDYAKNEDDRRVMELIFGIGQFLRCFSTPEGVPPDRLAALREGFARTMADPEFLKEAEKQMAAGIDYSTPRQIEDFLARVHQFPPSVIDRAAKFVGQ